ncbi:MAG TPA: carbamoyltransferase HypF [Candidatus Methanoperedenaceae archaeon]|nr:carbamoyltransferase HypF [Candidatus Methanoperedenaceae archaeon]
MAQKLTVYGVVQAVGFRPFVLRCALENGIRGTVCNCGDHVEIVAHGTPDALGRFRDMLESEKPQRAHISRIVVSETDGKEPESFSISGSRDAGSGEPSIIPPDIAACDDCVRELFTPGGRRFMYPFINCTSCGPRFTIIGDLPYDRSRTSMDSFRMCGSCASEYSSPEDRRCHAETVCCGSCGPSYVLHDGKRICGGIKEAAEKLDEGCIIAIKGTGGFHFACRADSDGAVGRLRELLGRSEQPFAVMARDISAVRRFARTSSGDEDALCSYARPIVVLDRKARGLSELVSPGLHNVGVMLPYLPVHHLLFHHSGCEALVMTSGNMPGEPMVLSAAEAFAKLYFADFFLVHDLDIVSRCDDSVVRDGKFIRRSRGFVPLGIPVQHNLKVLAVGAGMNNTFAISKDGMAFMSQHIGNTSNYDVMEYHKRALDHMMRLLRLNSGELDLIVSDMHPGYSVTGLAERISAQQNVPLRRVQHHAAHASSLAAESSGDVICIVADGAGYGSDGMIWGGEVMHGGERLGHLEYQKMPGGDLATEYPVRMLAAILSKTCGEDELLNYMHGYLSHFKYGERELEVMARQLVNRCIETSSCGRVLDAASALLGICFRRTYEGEGAMKLESFALGGHDLGMRMEIAGNVVITSGFFREMFDRLGEDKGMRSRRDLAMTLHTALAKAFCDIVLEYRDLKIPAGFSGGCAYNAIMSRVMKRELGRGGIEFLEHRKVPCGDGGVSFGQVSCV